MNGSGAKEMPRRLQPTGRGSVWKAGTTVRIAGIGVWRMVWYPVLLLACLIVLGAALSVGPASAVTRAEDPSPSPSPSPSSSLLAPEALCTPEAPCTALLDGAQFGIIAAGLGVLVMVSTVGVVASWGHRG